MSHRIVKLACAATVLVQITGDGADRAIEKFRHVAVPGAGKAGIAGEVRIVSRWIENAEMRHRVPPCPAV